VSLTSDHNPYLLWLNRGLAPRALVGGKGASLSELIELGAPVPSAFALTTQAYREFARRLSLPTQAIGIGDSDLPRIRTEIESTPLSPQIVELLVSGFRAFEQENDGCPVLAVRSSATAEDSAEFSFAGLHDTVLDVRDVPELERAVKQCWASLWSDRAVAYRRAGDLSTDDVEIAVVVQALIQSDISFVAFAADPVNGRDDYVIISATWGLGEAVVSGLVVPDHIVIDPGGTVVEYCVGDKHCMVIPARDGDQGIREVAVPRALRMVPVLTEPQATAIASIARDLSHRLGFKADIEGAVANGKVYLFQARPITTLSRDPHGGYPDPRKSD
jgi:pyruvate,water dikinase